LAKKLITNKSSGRKKNAPLIKALCEYLMNREPSKFLDELETKRKRKNYFIIGSLLCFVTLLVVIKYTSTERIVTGITGGSAVVHGVARAEKKVYVELTTGKKILALNTSDITYIKGKKVEVLERKYMFNTTSYHIVGYAELSHNKSPKSALRAGPR